MTIARSRRSLPASALWVLSLALFALAIAFASARVGLLRQAGDVRLSADWVLTDFYSAAYNPVRVVMEGGTPYTRDSTYPPYAPLHLLTHAPFALLSPSAAGISYFLFTILLTIPVAFLSLRLAGLRPPAHLVPLVAGALLLSRPGHWTLMLGQVSILLTLATYLVFDEQHVPERWRGAALAMALLKPTFGVPLAVLLWAWGRGRIVILGIGLAFLVNLPLVALFAVREGGILELARKAIGGYQGWQQIADVNPATSTTRIDLTSFFSRFLGEPLSDPGQVVLSLGVLLASVLVLRRLARQATRESGDLALAITCLATTLVGFHRGYDLVLLAAPMVTLWVNGVPSVAPAPTRFVLLCLFAVPALNWVATESAVTALRPSHPVWLMITSANTLCLLLLFCLYLWFATRYDANRASVTGGTPGGRRLEDVPALDQR